MSDNNFEKQVQQKLDELKLQPSESVWPTVESRIRKDKRRRRGLIIFPLIILLLGLGGYFAFYPGHSIISQTKSTDAIPGRTDDKSKQSVESTSTDNKNKIDNPVYLSEPSQPKTTAAKDVFTRKEKQTRNDFVVKKNQKSNTDQGSPGVARHQNVLEKETVNENKKESKRVEPKQNIGDPIMRADVKSVTEQIQPQDVNNKIQSVKDTSTKPLKTVAVVDSPVVHTSPKKKSQAMQTKWQWGLRMSAGTSGVNEGGLLGGLFSLDKSAVADFASGSSGSPTSGSQVYIPSSIHKGFSFWIGGYAEKKLSKKLSLSAGSQYVQFTNHINVGRRVDSSRIVNSGSYGLQSVERFYQADVTRKYTNRFHFIEVPVGLHTQLNKGDGAPFYWDAAVSISYLVSTTALHFDGSSGAYYEDKDLFNNVQFNVATGFSISLLNKSKTPVLIGPQLQYALTNLMKKGPSGGKHLIYFGLNSKLLLKK